MGYLRQEFLRGEKELARIAALRDECVGQAWSRENLPGKSTKYSSQTNNSNSLLTLMKSQSNIDINLRPTSCKSRRGMDIDTVIENSKQTSGLRVFSVDCLSSVLLSSEKRIFFLACLATNMPHRSSRKKTSKAKDKRHRRSHSGTG